MESLIAILDSANEETWYIAVDEICGFADLRIVDVDSSSRKDGANGTERNESSEIEGVQG